jgi:hypothetical protein
MIPDFINAIAREAEIIHVLQAAPQANMCKQPGSATTFPPWLTQVGWVTFTGVKEYTAAADFQADEQRHCVDRDSVYAWKEGEHRCEKYVCLAKPKRGPLRLLSWFLSCRLDTLVA